MMKIARLVERLRSDAAGWDLTSGDTPISESQTARLEREAADALERLQRELERCELERDTQRDITDAFKRERDEAVRHAAADCDELTMTSGLLQETIKERDEAYEKCARICETMTPDRKLLGIVGEAAHYIACANAIRSLTSGRKDR